MDAELALDLEVRIAVVMEGCDDAENNEDVAPD